MPSTSNRFIKALTLATIVVLAATCTDSELPTPPDVGEPSFLVLDGAHGGGNGDVFFVSGSHVWAPDRSETGLSIPTSRPLQTFARCLLGRDRTTTGP
jgi:hypothetical protein